jgi:hypothetical protein
MKIVREIEVTVCDNYGKCGNDADYIDKDGNKAFCEPCLDKLRSNKIKK